MMESSPVAPSQNIRFQMKQQLRQRLQDSKVQRNSIFSLQKQVQASTDRLRSSEEVTLDEWRDYENAYNHIEQTGSKIASAKKALGDAKLFNQRIQKKLEKLPSFEVLLGDKDPPQLMVEQATAIMVAYYGSADQVRGIDPRIAEALVSHELTSVKKAKEESEKKLMAEFSEKEKLWDEKKAKEIESLEAKHAKIVASKEAAITACAKTEQESLATLRKELVAKFTQDIADAKEAATTAAGEVEKNSLAALREELGAKFAQDLENAKEAERDTLRKELEGKYTEDLRQAQEADQKAAEESRTEALNSLRKELDQKHNEELKKAKEADEKKWSQSKTTALDTLRQRLEDEHAEELATARKADEKKFKERQTTALDALRQRLEDKHTEELATAKEADQKKFKERQTTALDALRQSLGDKHAEELATAKEADQKKYHKMQTSAINTLRQDLGEKHAKELTVAKDLAEKKAGELSNMIARNGKLAIEYIFRTLQLSLKWPQLDTTPRNILLEVAGLILKYADTKLENSGKAPSHIIFRLRFPGCGIDPDLTTWMEKSDAHILIAQFYIILDVDNPDDVSFYDNALFQLINEITMRLSKCQDGQIPLLLAYLYRKYTAKKKVPSLTGGMLGLALHHLMETVVSICPTDMLEKNRMSVRVEESEQYIRSCYPPLWTIYESLSQPPERPVQSLTSILGSRLLDFVQGFMISDTDIPVVILIQGSHFDMISKKHFFREPAIEEGTDDTCTVKGPDGFQTISFSYSTHGPNRHWLYENFQPDDSDFEGFMADITARIAEQDCLNTS